MRLFLKSVIFDPNNLRNRSFHLSFYPRGPVAACGVFANKDITCASGHFFVLAFVIFLMTKLSPVSGNVPRCLQSLTQARIAALTNTDKIGALTFASSRMLIRHEARDTR